VTWVELAIPGGLDKQMTINGLASINQFPVGKAGAIIRMVVQLSEVVTARFIRFTPTINGSPIARSLTMRNAEGRIEVLRCPPGKVVLPDRGRLGVRIETHAALAPAGTIEALVSFEVET
jgi:hypothetical protein